MADCVVDRGTPQFTIGSGDSEVIRSLDAAEYLKPMTSPGDPRPRTFEGRAGHCLARPIEVRGVEQSMLLEARFAPIGSESWDGRSSV
ncbi:hypothetical protein GCM10018780_78020 [Streptomyces lanatus]|nr:hypothetical protein GCM10018780_78020 [Streptomyces lanatus]